MPYLSADLRLERRSDNFLEKIPYIFPVPLILGLYLSMRKTIVLSVFVRSVASKKMSNRSRNDHLGAPNDAVEVATCQQKVVPPQTDHEEEYFRFRRALGMAGHPQASWSRRGGGTGFRLTFQLRESRSERVLNRFFIGWTFIDATDLTNTLSTIVLRIGRYKPNISGTGKL